MKDQNGVEVRIGDKAVACSSECINNGHIGVVCDIKPDPDDPTTLNARLADKQGVWEHWSSWCRSDQFVVIQESTP